MSSKEEQEMELEMSDATPLPLEAMRLQSNASITTEVNNAFTPLSPGLNPTLNSS